MPCLEVMQTEALRIGLTTDDAAYLYDRWMANGFTQGHYKIQSWRHAMLYWWRNGWFPSQKGLPPGQGTESYVTLARVQSWCGRHKVSKMQGRAWGELMGGKFRGTPITNEVDLDAALEVIKAQWMKEPS